MIAPAQQYAKNKAREEGGIIEEYVSQFYEDNERLFDLSKGITLEDVASDSGIKIKVHETDTRSLLRDAVSFVEYCASYLKTNEAFIQGLAKILRISREQLQTLYEASLTRLGDEARAIIEDHAKYLRQNPYPDDLRI